VKESVTVPFAVEMASVPSAYDIEAGGDVRRRDDLALKVRGRGLDRYAAGRVQGGDPRCAGCDEQGQAVGIVPDDGSRVDHLIAAAAELGKQHVAFRRGGRPVRIAELHGEPDGAVAERGRRHVPDEIEDVGIAASALVDEVVMQIQRLGPVAV